MNLAPSAGVYGLMRFLHVLPALLIAVPRIGVAQVTVVDEGSFTVTRDGRTGREDFRIVRTPSGSGFVLVAAGTTVLGTARTVTALRTDTSGAPLAYQLEGREAGNVRERVSVQVGHGRISARAQSPRGESAREYFLKDGMLVLDEDVVHQYYFLALHPERSMVSVVLPRRNVVADLRVVNKGDEPIEIAGSRVVARHLGFADGAGEREVWVDALGRVLRVDAPVLGLVAVRDALPATP
jgi:hypothetical protein